MDKLVFSDKVLNQQICSKCLNYLSVGPVLVFCEDRIVCGRCSKNMAATVNDLKYSLYNLVAEKLVFKCINHYDGCEELLFFNEATEHEKKCQKNKLVCPFCDFQGNGCQLVHHFEKEHPEEVIKEDTFQIIIADTLSKKMVLVKNSRIFCLSIVVRDTFIEIFHFLVAPADLECEHFRLKFFKSDSHIQFVTPQIPITKGHNDFPSSTSKDNVKRTGNYFVLDRDEIDDCFPSAWCLCKFELIDKLSSEYDKNLNCCNKIIRKIDTNLSSSTSLSETSVVKGVNGKDFNLIDTILKMSVSNLRDFVKSEYFRKPECNNCKRAVPTTSFNLCPKYHISCNECVSKKCPKCKVFCPWKNNSKINKFSLMCEWKGCSKDQNIFEYMLHKHSCEFREYRCPDNECDFIGKLSDLKNHWHLTPIEYSRGRIRVYLLNQAVYSLIQYDLFYIVTEFEDISGKFSITINELDVISGKDNFSIEFYANRGYVQAAFTKAQTDLPCRNKSIHFVKFLCKEELEKMFYLVLT